MTHSTSFPTQESQRWTNRSLAWLVAVMGLFLTVGCSTGKVGTSQSLFAVFQPKPAAWGGPDGNQEAGGPARTYRSEEDLGALVETSADPLIHRGDPNDIHSRLFRLPTKHRVAGTRHRQNFSKQQEARWLVDYQQTIGQAKRQANIARQQHRLQRQESSASKPHPLFPVVQQFSLPNDGRRQPSVNSKDGGLNDQGKDQLGTSAESLALPTAPLPFESPVQRAARSLPKVTPFQRR